MSSLFGSGKKKGTSRRTTQRSKTKRTAPKSSSMGVPVTIKTHKDKNGGHPHVIVDDYKNNHVSVGLTTKNKKGKNSTNYKLEQNPLGDGKTSYMRRQGTVDKKETYTNPRQCTMTKKDFAQAQEYGSKAKQKFIEKENKKG